MVVHGALCGAGQEVDDAPVPLATHPGATANCPLGTLPLLTARPPIRGQRQMEHSGHDRHSVCGCAGPPSARRTPDFSGLASAKWEKTSPCEGTGKGRVPRERAGVASVGPRPEGEIGVERARRNRSKCDARGATGGGERNESRRARLSDVPRSPEFASAGGIELRFALPRCESP